MQLKRDTDYALRILFCLKNTIKCDNKEKQRGMSLSEIARKTRVPRAMADRICKYLRDKGMVYTLRKDGPGEDMYYCNHLLFGKTLLDVIEAVENTSEIFAVFDKKSHMYKNCEREILFVQRRIARILASTSLEEFIGGKNSFYI